MQICLYGRANAKLVKFGFNNILGHTLQKVENRFETLAETTEDTTNELWEMKKTDTWEKT